MALFFRMKAAFLIVFLFLNGALHGQNFIMDGTDVTACSGFFLDSGGGNSPYGPNENITQTICASGVPGEGTHIQLTFSGVNFPAGDDLTFLMVRILMRRPCLQPVFSIPAILSSFKLPQPTPAAA